MSRNIEVHDASPVVSEHQEYVQDVERVGSVVPPSASAKQEEQFYKDAHLATIEKGQAMITIAVNWVADQLRKSIREA